MKHKILIMAVLLFAILIGGIGGFAINSFLYDKSAIIKTERKENNEQLEEDEKDEEDDEDEDELSRQGSIARIDYPLIDIYFDKNKNYKVTIKEFGNSQEIYKEYKDKGDFFQFNKEKFSILTVPSGRGTTPKYILRVEEENECIKTIDCIEIRTDF